MLTTKQELIKLDRTDRKILEHLQRDGALTNQELAEKSRAVAVTLSAAGPVSRGSWNNPASGNNTGSQKLGLSLTAIILIGMDRHTPERFASFEEKVGEYDEVQECYLITGQDADYMLKVVVPDMDHYHHFLLNKITRIQGVSGVHSSFVLRRVIDSTALPLGYLT